MAPSVGAAGRLRPASWGVVTPMMKMKMFQEFSFIGVFLGNGVQELKTLQGATSANFGPLYIHSGSCASRQQEKKHNLECKM